MNQLDQDLTFFRKNIIHVESGQLLEFLGTLQFQLGNSDVMVGALGQFGPGRRDPNGESLRLTVFAIKQELLKWLQEVCS